MRAFLIALQFLTRIPVHLRRAPSAEETRRSLGYYPLVGLLMGMLLAGASWLIAALPSLLAGVLLLAVWVGLTGALHIDGLADTVDAWAGGHGDAERTLRIMKDPAIGPMGVTVVVLLLGVKWASLVTFQEAGAHMMVMMAPLLGRTVIPLLFLTTAHVRPDGLGAAMAQEPSRLILTAVVVCGFAVVLLIGGTAGFVAAVVGLAVFLLLRHSMCRRIGGTTGDTAGALVELTEMAALLAAAILLAAFSVN